MEIFSVIAGDLLAGDWVIKDSRSRSLVSSIDNRDKADMSRLVSIEILTKEKLTELKRSHFRSLRGEFRSLRNYDYESLNHPGFLKVYMVCRLADGREFLATVLKTQASLYETQVTESKLSPDELKEKRKKETRTLLVTVALLLGIIIILGNCGKSQPQKPYIKTLTAEEVKQGCEVAEAAYEAANSKATREKSDLMQDFQSNYGSTISKQNLDEAVGYAASMAEVDKEADEKFDSYWWWCKKVKPGTRVEVTEDSYKVID